MKPTLLVLDEPTEGIQPSIIKDIGRAIMYLRDKGTMAIVLVEHTSTSLASSRTNSSSWNAALW